VSNDLLEPCPACGKDIECTEPICPFCRVDLTKPLPAPKAPKPPKVSKPKPPKTDTPKPSGDLLEPCPNCGKRIECTELVCPFCKMDLSTAPKPTKQKSSPVLKNANPVDVRSEDFRHHKPDRHARIMVPALGRQGRPSLDFPELHWKPGTEVTDDALLEWAYHLREVWPARAEERGWLSNHALGYLASWADGPHDDPLRKNHDKIVALLGGNDWKF